MRWEHRAGEQNALAGLCTIQSDQLVIELVALLAWPAEADDFVSETRYPAAAKMWIGP